MKFVTIIGARPQFIKAAQFSRLLRQRHEEILVHTGQHYSENMSEIFFEELNIPKPDYNLGIGSASHGKQTARMIESIEEILLREKPDAVIVYGDTNSTLAGSIAASKLLLPIYHIEAGLRSYNMNMPEEQNRVISDHLSKILFCPTQTAVDNLKKEGIVNGVFNVGDIMYDAIIYNINKAEDLLSLQLINNTLSKYIDTNKINRNQYYLSTIHRAENTDNKRNLEIILSAFEKLDYPVIMPLHPRTRKILETINTKFSNTIIIEPIGYLEMIFLTKNSKMVITDSGGLQKEAFFLKKPCTTLRKETEWIETLVNGWNALCEIDEESILKSVNRNNILEYPQENKFGIGNTSELILNIIERGK